MASAEYMKKYLQIPKNLEKHKIREKKYYQKNRITILEKIRIREDEDRDRLNKGRRERRIKLKRQILSHYSNNTLICGCCSESIYDFLTIDHINGGGRKHIQEIKGNGIYQWLKNNNFPEGFQVLCYNCNCARSRQPNNKCPHKDANFI